MIIEVAGTSTRNKGAELMLVAIAAHYAAARPEVHLAVDPWFGSFDDRAQYGLRSLLSMRKFGRSSLVARLMSPGFRRTYGLAIERDTSAVLDASGFAFGDQLGAERSEAFARDVQRWKSAGKRVILLPQALGPFRQPQVRRAFAVVLETADLVYAREPASFEYARELAGPATNLRQAPDFTNLVTGTVPSGFDSPERMACIVPNHQMVAKTAEREQAAYLAFLARCAAQLRASGLSPVILLHDAVMDETLVDPLQRAMGDPLPVIRDRNPRNLKGILGCAEVVVGSRFHALVGALSQGIPCIAAGWSHKYEMLFADYGCPECVLSPMSSDEQIRETLDRVTGQPSRSRLLAILKEAASGQKRLAADMWREVDGCLGVSTDPASPVEPAVSRGVAAVPAAASSKDDR